MQNKNRKKIITYILFPILLFVAPLLRCNIGVDVTDTGYSLGSFIYQGGQMGEDWVRFATYLATQIGSFFARLPYGDTLMGMNLYTGLFVSATALLAYFFLMKKIPAWITFLGELLAISLCWCPTVILYNYVTYFLFTVMIVFLYKGITEDKKSWLILAGITYGCNVMTRFPNITHGALILAVWFGAWQYGSNLKKIEPLEKKNTDKKNVDKESVDKENTHKKVWVRGAQQTLWCMLGFFIGFGGILLAITCRYGIHSYLDMIASLFGGEGGVEGHSLGDMVWSIVDAYLVGCKWMLFALAVILGGFVLFSICRDRFLWIKRILYIGVVLVLFRFYYGRGMFNLRYYAYESMFQWAVLFLIIAIVTLMIVLFRKESTENQKLMALMILLLIMVTPLGSDNYLYPNINNLFFVAPVVLYWLMVYIKMGSVYFMKIKERFWVSAYPVKCMLVMILLITFFQSICFGSTFVFRDGMLGEKRDTVIMENKVLKGMHTNSTTAESIEGITAYCEEHQLTGRKVILYGNIPAMSCFLQMPSALSTSWADLASYPDALMEQDLMTAANASKEHDDARPIVILSCAFDAWLTEDAEGMKRFNLDPTTYDEDTKAALLKAYITDNHYTETYLNEQFVIYE